MDPLALLQVVWKHRRFAIPAFALALALAGYVFILGPRAYEATSISVVIGPDIPTDRELERYPKLSQLNSDNPYLRGSDQSLIVSASIARLSGQDVADQLEAAGLSTDYTIAPSPSNQMTVVVTAVGDSPEVAMATREWLDARLRTELHDLQTVNGADERYMFTIIPVDVMAEAKEKISSRIRKLIIVMAAGVMLVLGVTSVAESVESRRARRQRTQDAAAVTEGEGGGEGSEEPKSRESDGGASDKKSARASRVRKRDVQEQEAEWDGWGSGETPDTPSTVGKADVG